MRLIGLTCTAFFFLTLPVSAQNSAVAPQPSPERLDTLLKNWEVRMANVERFSTKVSRTNTHPLTKKTLTYIGEAAFMKPSLARIDLTFQDEVGKKDAEKTNFERMFCNGQYIYEYSPKDKLIIIHDIPKNDPTADNLILAFLRGMKAVDARKRFGMALTKEDAWYAYVYITPKSDADKQEFSAAQLTIFVKNPNPANTPDLSMLPCRLWYKRPDGGEVTYTFSEMQPNGQQLDKESFVPRRIDGYEVKKANATPMPPMPPMSPKPPLVRPQMP